MLTALTHIDSPALTAHCHAPKKLLCFTMCKSLSERGVTACHACQVGTGFSYVEEGANLTATNAEIAADLMAFLRAFLHLKPQVYRSCPCTPHLLFCTTWIGTPPMCVD